MEIMYCSQCNYPSPIPFSTCPKCGASVSFSTTDVKSSVDVGENNSISGSPEQPNLTDSISLCDETIPSASEEWRQLLKTASLGNQFDKVNEAVPINLEKEHETQRLNCTNEEDYTLRAGTVHFRGDLILRHLDSDMEFVILNHELQRDIVLGRVDRKSGINPTIDLTNLEDNPKAISRCHVIINEHEGLLLIIDQKSTNGTYLNGQHLVPYQPRVLRDKDILWLGRVKFMVCFRCPKD